jgi:hypothetical protein
MERRKFIAGLGSLTAAGAAGIGTGAFTSVQAERSITINTAGDASAYLSLDAQGTENSDAYVDDSGDEIEITLTGTQEGGSGINESARTTLRDLIQVENQGTQGVIFGHKQSFAPQTAYLYHDDPAFKPGGNQQQAGEVFTSLGSPDNSGTNLDSIATKNLPYLDVGDKLDNVGMTVNILSEGDLPSDFSNETITFVAATEPSEL